MDPLRDLTDKIVAYDTQAVDKIVKDTEKICKRVNEMCDEGDREVRLLTGKFTVSDIIGEGK